MALSKKAQITRGNILAAANELFYLQGYHATGLDKVIKTAGVTKGNFYYYFKSKEELAVQTIEWHFNSIAEQTKLAIKDNNDSPLATLLIILESMSTRQKSQQQDGHICGCFFGNLSLEMSAESKPVRDKLKFIFSQFIDNFTVLLQAAHKAGEIAAHIDPAEAAAIIMSQIEGAILLDKTNQETRNVDRSIEFIRVFLTRQ